MRSRLLRAVVVYALSITGGGVGTAMVALTVSGCGDDGVGDMSAPPDMTAPRPDCGLPCSPRDLANVGDG